MLPYVNFSLSWLPDSYLDIRSTHFYARPSQAWIIQYSLQKTVGKVSLILITLTSRNDSDCQSSKVSLKENKPDGVNPNSNDIEYYVRENEGKIRWFSAD